MRYINVKAVREKIRDNDKQISTDALHAIDVKIDVLLEKAVRQFNGHKKRITGDLINILKA